MDTTLLGGLHSAQRQERQARDASLRTVTRCKILIVVRVIENRFFSRRLALGTGMIRLVLAAPQSAGLAALPSPSQDGPAPLSPIAKSAAPGALGWEMGDAVSRKQVT